MSYETLENQIRAIPEEYFSEIANFLDLLKYKVVAQQQSSSRPLRKLGGYEGRIKIAADFDDIPEGFEEYV
ncbi:MAG: DUF2281 domain-containing protein [Treponema sp.]|nr:DUF2281 domain-containing protein [Treponema sp.]